MTQTDQTLTANSPRRSAQPTLPARRSPPIRTQLADLDVDTAYEIQEANTGYWLALGRRIVGSKIGLTSPRSRSSWASTVPTSASCSPI